MKPGKLTTITPVQFQDWIIQASIWNNDSICVIVRHTNNLRCFVSFFEDEEKANKFVRSIIYDRDAFKVRPDDR